MARDGCHIGAFQVPEVRIADLRQAEDNAGLTFFNFQVSCRDRSRMGRLPS